MRLDPALGLIPEISGHRLMVSIRLMRQDDEGRLRQISEDAAFGAHALFVMSDGPSFTRKVRCPTAGRQPVRAREPYRPFCSERCRAIDLGAWSTEQFRVEAHPEPTTISTNPASGTEQAARHQGSHGPRWPGELHRLPAARFGGTDVAGMSSRKTS